MAEQDQWMTYLTAISVLIAGVGIMYSGRLQRSLSRKHHTISTIFAVHFNDDYKDSFEIIRPYLDDVKLAVAEKAKHAVRKILNFYEFLCAGVGTGTWTKTCCSTCEAGPY